MAKKDTDMGCVKREESGRINDDTAPARTADEESQPLLADVVLESRLPTATVAQTAMNLVKGYIASGILALPHAFAQSGLFAGVFIMASILLMSLHSMLVLIDCKHALKGAATTYADIATVTYGRKMHIAVNTLLIFTQFGFSVVYMVYVSENLSYYWPIKFSNVYILLCLFPIFVGMSWIRTMRWLGPASQFANVMLLLGLIIIIAVSCAQLSTRDIPDVSLQLDWWVHWKTLPVMFGTAVYSIEGIGIVIPCETSMLEPKKFPKVLSICVLCSGVLYIFFAVLPYLAFGRDVSDQLANDISLYAANAGSSEHLWNVLANISRISLVIAILISFPIQLFVVTDICEEAMFKPGRAPIHHKKAIQNLFRLALCIVAAIIALTVPQFGLLVALIGNIGGATLQFVFPGLFYFKLYPTGHKVKKGFLILYMVIGVVGGIMGTIVTVEQLIKTF